jgi:hypothetical protein
MNYRTVIQTALSSLNVPVSFQVYRGTATTYVTFFCYNQMSELYAENIEIATGYYVQIDIWSKTDDYDILAEQIKTAMTTAGFQGYTAQDLYESDTKIFHKAIRFNIIN